MCVTEKEKTTQVLCLCAGDSRSWRGDIVIGLSVCPFHSCECDMSGTPWQHSYIPRVSSDLTLVWMDRCSLLFVGVCQLKWYFFWTKHSSIHQLLEVVAPLSFSTSVAATAKCQGFPGTCFGCEIFCLEILLRILKASSPLSHSELMLSSQVCHSHAQKRKVAHHY